MSIDSPMTHCLQCGTAVSLSSVLNRFGCCDTCYTVFTKGRNISAHLPKDFLVFAGYGPGFAEDLTRWETVIRFDGSLTQSINWWEYVWGKRGTEIREAVVSEDGLSEIIAKIEAIDRLGIAALNRHYCIEDTENVFIIAPELGFHASAALYTFSNIAKREPIPDVAKSGLETFQTAWKAIESYSPYRVSMHWRRK